MNIDRSRYSRIVVLAAREFPPAPVCAPIGGPTVLRATVEIMFDGVSKGDWLVKELV